MAKFLRFIGFLILALAFWQTASNAFAHRKADVVMQMSGNELTVYHQESTTISLPQLPYLPDAELSGMSGQSQFLTFSRLQRYIMTEYILSVKDWIDKLAQREAVLSLHREKLYDVTPHYRCQPVCEYYIFTLRRIII